MAESIAVCCGPESCEPCGCPPAAEAVMADGSAEAIRESVRRHYALAARSTAAQITAPAGAAWTGCIAGVLTEAEFRTALLRAGFTARTFTATHRVHVHPTAMIIRAQRELEAPPAPAA